jgi:menaquinone-9 beta-reductase
MVKQEHADVVVVGGGPAGSSTATRLARYGLDVVLLDKARFPRDKACAEYCSPGVVDALEDLGALDRVRERDHRSLGGMRVVARGREIPLHFSLDRPESNQAIGVKRSILDEELLTLAADSGVRVLQETRVRAPIIDNGTVNGVIARNGGDEFRISSRFVVGADGLHSTIARGLKLDRPIRWPRRLGLVARFTGLPEPVSYGQMHVGYDMYCGLSPVTGNEANVSLVVPLGYKPDGVPTGQFYDEMIRQLPGIDNLLGDAERITTVRGLGPLGKRVRKPSGRGFLLVGDASGFFDPLTGEGIHRALNGGKLAARYTLRALERRDRRPVGYRRARSRTFGDKQRVCQIIQILLASSSALDYVTGRVIKRNEVETTLRGILGDYTPANQAFSPSFLWNLLRP